MFGLSVFLRGGDDATHLLHGETGRGATRQRVDPQLDSIRQAGELGGVAWKLASVRVLPMVAPPQRVREQAQGPQHAS
jgi:hypothetical protein